MSIVMPTIQRTYPLYDWSATSDGVGNVWLYATNAEPKRLIATKSGMPDFRTAWLWARATALRYARENKLHLVQPRK